MPGQAAIDDLFEALERQRKGAAVKNKNLKVMLDSLVENMTESDSQVGMAQFVLEDGTECALILSLDTPATQLFDAAAQVISESIPGASVMDESYAFGDN